MLHQRAVQNTYVALPVAEYDGILHVFRLQNVPQHIALVEAVRWNELLCHG